MTDTRQEPEAATDEPARSSIRFEIVTLFPEIVAALRVGLLGKAIDAGVVEIEAINPRELATDKHRSTDDAPYGGGSGMVMMPGPIVGALERLDEARHGRPTRRVLLTPQGAVFDQRVAERFASLSCVTFVCGRYEGFDERIRGFVDEEISLGDFVLLGGEIAALTMIEASARLVPGVLGNEGSAVEESHQSGLLEYPQYTRPAEFRGLRVPGILSSGNHAAIARWRRKEALRRTRARRPDLFARLEPTKLDRALLAELDAEQETDS
ncbi:MAG: tRNA (guanosine(37)-N1)-methyltransferase TrmD [Myxococcales bacterium]|nr:tRNA (guanosine(37)-N1)-methyltransferase TrmD [Myxococcales bacterium]